MPVWLCVRIKHTDTESTPSAMIRQKIGNFPIQQTDLIIQFYSNSISRYVHADVSTWGLMGLDQMRPINGGSYPGSVWPWPTSALCGVAGKRIIALTNGWGRCSVVFATGTSPATVRRQRRHHHHRWCCWLVIESWTTIIPGWKGGMQCRIILLFF